MNREELAARISARRPNLNPHGAPTYVVQEESDDYRIGVLGASPSLEAAWRTYRQALDEVPDGTTVTIWEWYDDSCRPRVVVSTLMPKIPTTSDLRRSRRAWARYHRAEARRDAEADANIRAYGWF